MKRLTQEDEQGNWCVKGLPWKDTYVGQIITENTREKIYGALCKLKDYEDSGLDPEEAYSLKERDTKKIIYAEKKTSFGRFGNCPNCGRRLRDYDCSMFCGSCGQRLKWED